MITRKARNTVLVGLQILSILSIQNEAFSAPNDQTSRFWHQKGRASYQKLFQGQRFKKAKNVILFIGDGMGPSTVTSARILEGQLKGLQGEDNLLSFENFPYSAFSKTYNVDAQVPDSAGTMTAMVAGVKTRIGVLSIGPEQPRGVCAGSQNYWLPTIMEKAESRGLMTGIVTTTRVTHATPAALYAHAAERDWESDVNLSQEAKEQGCTDIASQLINFKYGDGIDVILAGGRQQFLGADQIDPEYPTVKGNRLYKQDLTAAWLKNNGPSAQYVWNQAQFKAAANQPGKLLGLFEPSHMRYESERAKDGAGEPSLTEMTETAIRKMKDNEEGFFLMVEAGRIDHAHHDGFAAKALYDTVELSKAVKRARELTRSDETLIIVTADHSHTLTISGYPVRGNPILGKVMDVEGGGALAKDLLGMPFTTLSYANGPGAWQSKDAPESARPDLSDVDTEALNFRVHSAIPLQSETHSGEDVGVYASGPMSGLFHGVIEQNVIYHVIDGALGLGNKPKTYQLIGIKN